MKCSNCGIALKGTADCRIVGREKRLECFDTDACTARRSEKERIARDAWRH